VFIPETHQEAALDYLAQSNCTMHPRDRVAAAILIRGAGRPAIDALKRHRRARLNSECMSQRRWQVKARRVHENRNLRQRTERQNFGVYEERGTAREVALKCLVEAIETREMYVRRETP
jgi:hypothetical protein